MSVGDLVFAHGYRGLILETHHAVHYTEHYVYWFCYSKNPEDRCCWVTEKQIFKVSECIEKVN